MRQAKRAAPAFDLSILEKASDLKKRIGFVFLVLLVYRLGSFIPLPGLDAKILKVVSSSATSGMLEMFNMISGGSLARMSVFALSIMPYITASIVLHLLSVMVPYFSELRKQGDAGRSKLNQYTKYFTLVLATMQSFGIAKWLIKLSLDQPLVVIDYQMFTIITVSTLAAGTMLLMWLGDQINSRGIGNGISFIIFAGIVSGLPSSIISMFSLGKTGALSGIAIFMVLLVVVGLFTLIVYVEKATRQITVTYPKKQVGNKVYAGDTTHMPLKLNTAGVIPPIFASSLLLFPQTLLNFMGAGQGNEVMVQIAANLNHGKPLYMVFSAVMIIFFAFFYTSVIFNPEETAENLRKFGGYIPGKRPGKATAEFFDYTLTRLTALGAIYLVVICLLPEIMISAYRVPFYLGGTSLLIMVNVILDLIVQIQSHLFSAQYQGIIKKFKVK